MSYFLRQWNAKRNYVEKHIPIMSSLLISQREWKDKLLKVTVEPATKFVDLAEKGVHLWEMVDEQLDKDLRRWNPKPDVLSTSRRR